MRGAEKYTKNQTIAWGLTGTKGLGTHMTRHSPSVEMQMPSELMGWTGGRQAAPEAEPICA